MAGIRAKQWIKKTVEKVDVIFGGKRESETVSKLDPVEAYNAYMREQFRLAAQNPYLSEWDRQLYRNGFEEADFVQIQLYNLYG